MASYHIISVLLISPDDRRKVSANSLKEVGYYFPQIEVIKERFLSNLVDTVSYSTQTNCLLQILLKPLSNHIISYHILLFNKLSLCPYMVRKPSISVSQHDRYPAIYVNDHIWKCTADFLSLLVWRPF